MAGLSGGILDNASLPIKAINGVTKKLTSAGSSIPLGGVMPSLVSPQEAFSQTGNATNSAQTINYYAAPNQSLDAEQALLQAVKRARVITGW